MTRALTKAEAREFKARWQRVNDREVEELRSASLELRLQQFNTMLAWAQQPGWAESLSEGVEEVRQRWIKLRKMYRG